MIIVQTTARPGGVSYLSDTLRAIGPCGRRRIVVSDGAMPEGLAVPDGWELRAFPWRGARATGWACLRLALEDGAADLILLQDDIAICQGGIDVMDAIPVPAECSAVTFYSSSALPGLQPKALGAPRLIIIGASGTAQALKIPRRALEYLCALDPLSAPHIMPTEPHLFDDSLFALARSSPWPYVAHLVPNLVRHVGAVSACGTTRAFRQPWAVPVDSQFPARVDALPRHVVPYEAPCS